MKKKKKSAVQNAQLFTTQNVTSFTRVSDFITFSEDSLERNYFQRSLITLNFIKSLIRFQEILKVMVLLKAYF